jgi:hypothetical protein
VVSPNHSSSIAATEPRPIHPRRPIMAFPDALF